MLFLDPFLLLFFGLPGAPSNALSVSCLIPGLGLSEDLVKTAMAILERHDTLVPWLGHGRYGRQGRLGPEQPAEVGRHDVLVGHVQEALKTVQLRLLYTVKWVQSLVA